jgi:hypothetical protein
MPVLQTKIEGRGNGIKTVIPNMEDVARALARPPTCKSDIACQPSLDVYTTGLRLTNRPRQVLRLRARRPDVIRR